MIHSLLHWTVSALALLATAYLVPGFKLRSLPSALAASIVIGVANTLVWPVLIFLTLPINILTLGLFTFAVNGAVLKISALVIPGFSIKTWTAAIAGAIILSVIGTILHFFLV